MQPSRAPVAAAIGQPALGLGDGNPEDFFNLVDTFGKFQIERLVVKRNDN